MILALVCARRGSTGLRHKNMKELCGRTLLEIAIDKAGPADDCVVSTDINPAAFDIGTARLRERPGSLRGGRISKWQVWRDALKWHDKNGAEKADAIVDIDVSRPLTTTTDVRAVMATYKTGRCAVTLGVCEASKHPAFDIYRTSQRWGLMPCEGMGDIIARQQLDIVYNYGGICVVGRRALEETPHWFAGSVGFHVIPRRRCFDIDDALDWEIVQDQWERQR